uniref:Uncharacterized protein n=1 Tax=Rhizophora mucronata TaxID=61149 RepID=A0A2P2Q7V0_RHIMU
MYHCQPADLRGFYRWSIRRGFSH